MRKSPAFVLAACLLLSVFSACRQSGGTAASASAVPSLPGGTQSRPVFTSSDWKSSDVNVEYTVSKYPQLINLLTDKNIEKIDYAPSLPDTLTLTLKTKDKNTAIREINRLRARPEAYDAIPDSTLQATNSMAFESKIPLSSLS